MGVSYGGFVNNLRIYYSKTTATRLPAEGRREQRARRQQAHYLRQIAPGSNLV